MATQEQLVSRTGGRVQPLRGRKAEAFWWKFMRLSGILLLPLVFGHLAIVHLINSVAVINYEWVVTTRWSILPWRIYDAGMLWFASLHGFRGLKYVVDDYFHQEGLNRVVTVLVVVLALVLIGVGTIAILGTPFSLN
jgi:succinate dehydrogenase / fumarate reductase membrane anchor subunit